MTSTKPSKSSTILHDLVSQCLTKTARILAVLVTVVSSMRMEYFFPCSSSLSSLEKASLMTRLHRAPAFKENNAVLRIRIWNPVHFAPWIQIRDLDLGSFFLDYGSLQHVKLQLSLFPLKCRKRRKIKFCMKIYDNDGLILYENRTGRFILPPSFHVVPVSRI
jgi:hypothetical protein